MRQLRRIGLDGQAHEIAGNLALGPQRLVEIARALAGDPSLLLVVTHISSPKVKIGDVRFVGNHHFKSKKLRGEIEARLKVLVDKLRGAADAMSMTASSFRTRPRGTLRVCASLSRQAATSISTAISTPSTERGNSTRPSLSSFVVPVAA